MRCYLAGYPGTNRDGSRFRLAMLQSDDSTALVVVIKITESARGHAKCP